ncbi:cobalt-precorrin-6A reductase [Syntrophotalea carbinolica DSM 2380]|uniref:Cobalt-precorrin-6A reductase n=1 Tax=Syntrophotalea carbinolica (strain DSM 2380 / NBRC 103641 / GraBd1) TaxID=338963 RepID=Q3A7B4_SYNC1|nr:precorrin-6A reductase [Syntrophotalea carbinolica]ABA87730.1 cobalt-precorrin-6A reductase [Syntrophotalea carbinolica DSM 2380]
MIMLLGGTSETAPLATALLETGYRVLVSTATDAPLPLPGHPSLERRHGRLDAAAMANLMRQRGVRVLIDAAHPYAAQARTQAQQATAALDLPYLRWERPATDFDGFAVTWADDHTQAARLACADGRPVLLTTGSRHLAPYVAQARLTGVRLRARVLPHAESRNAVQQAGLAPEETIWGQGPFSVESNRSHIQQHGIGVLVTKDSGQAGGVPAKLQAAHLERCIVIVVRRPVSHDPIATFQHLPELLKAVTAILPLSGQPF